MLSVVVDERARAELTTDLDELFREGARRMLAVALEAEVDGRPVALGGPKHERALAQETGVSDSGSRLAGGGRLRLGELRTGVGAKV